MVLIVKIRDDKVWNPIAIDVSGINSHSRSGESASVISHLCVECDIFKPPVSLVDEKQIGRRVARNEKIGQSVIVDVNGHYPEGASYQFVETCLPADVGKCPIADSPRGIGGWWHL